MKKFTIIAIIILSFASFAFAKDLTDKELVEKVSMGYLEGFYEGDTEKLKNSLDVNLKKYGFWKNEKSGEYGKAIHMTFEGALEFATDVKEKKKFPKADAPKNVEVIEVLEKIAISKVTAWWGVDYILLAKNDGKWMIRQVIWEGPTKIFDITDAEYQAVKDAGLGYIEGFYEGDTAKLTNSLKPTLFKYGYGFNRKEGKYYDGSQMTFAKAIAYAKRVKEKKNFAKADAPKKVEVLDVLNKIAAVKVTAFWGVDYMLLSKDGDKWMIEQVIWAGNSKKQLFVFFQDLLRLEQDKMKSEAKTVDQYIKEAAEDRIGALKQLRELCLTHLPEYSESMAYKMPSYKNGDEVEVAFASQKQHLCVYFLIHEVMLNNKDLLKGLNHGKGCIRYANPDNIDFELIKKLLTETAESNNTIC